MTEGLQIALLTILVLLVVAVVALCVIYAIQRKWLKVDAPWITGDKPRSREGLSPSPDLDTEMTQDIHRRNPVTNPNNIPIANGMTSSSANFEDPTVTLVKVADLPQYLRIRRAKNIIKEEYTNLPGKDYGTTEVGSMDVNRTKNRFKNIITYDDSRVVLHQLEGDPYSDYINASRINGYKKPNAYILTQGPKKETAGDFWRMVWEQRSTIILMATDLVEKGRDRCFKYWPDLLEDVAFGDILVQNDREEIFTDSVIRTFRVTMGTTVREVKHFHYKTWKDMSAGDYPLAVVAFLKKINDYKAPQSGPLVVHCSAGVGRSGSFVTIDAMLQMAEAEGQIDVFSFIQDGRTRRTQFVQVFDQYDFIYTVLLESTIFGITEIQASDVRIKMKELKSQDPNTRKTGFQKEFENLKQLCNPPKLEDCKAGRQPKNVNKNRYPDVIPLELSRPYLMTQVDDPDSTDYINASFLPGYNRKDGFLATQMPLSNTRVDFWRMIWDYNIRVIVMLNDLKTDDMIQGKYWSDERAESFGPFSIEVMSNTAAGTCDIRKMRITNTKKTEAPRYVQHVHMTNWSNDTDIPPSNKVMVDLATLVERAQQESGNNPIGVHCKNGLGSTGVFCAVYKNCEKVKTEQSFDVLQAVKTLRLHRYGMVETLTQYQYIYDVLLLYLDSFATYSNFQQ